MTLLGALGAIYLKRASSVRGVLSLIKTPSFYVAVLCYGLSSLLNIFVLTMMDYAVVLPLCAVTYVWTCVLSVLYYRERITLNKIAGISLIILGTVFISFV